MQPAVSELRLRNRVLFILVAVLALAGIVVSAISLQRHYAKSATEFCDFSQKFNCDVVNRSEYSEVQGIPVAAIGVIGYAALFFLSAFSTSHVETPTRLLATSIAGLFFASYLTYIEAFRLKTWCILCIVSQALILVIAACAAILKLRRATA